MRKDVIAQDIAADEGPIRISVAFTDSRPEEIEASIANKYPGHNPGNVKMSAGCQDHVARFAQGVLKSTATAEWDN
jgi:hypothetical protein